MAYDAELAGRIRVLMARQPGVMEKKMFGGIAFLVGGNICVGVHGDEMIARIGEAQMPEALHAPGVRVFDITGRPMKGWVMVAADAVATAAAIDDWVGRALRFVASLPAK